MPRMATPLITSRLTMRSARAVGCEARAIWCVYHTSEKCIVRLATSLSTQPEKGHAVLGTVGLCIGSSSRSELSLVGWVLASGSVDVDRFQRSDRRRGGYRDDSDRGQWFEPDSVTHVVSLQQISHRHWSLTPVSVGGDQQHIWPPSTHPSTPPQTAGPVESGQGLLSHGHS